MTTDLTENLLGKRVAPRGNPFPWPMEDQFATVRAVWLDAGCLKLLCEGTTGLYEVWATHVKMVSTARAR